MYQLPTKDTYLSLFSKISAVLAASMVVLIIAYLLKESFDFFQQVSWLRFFSDESWAPTDSLYNILPMVMGSLLAAVGCLLVCVPLGMVMAFYLNFYCPPWAKKKIKHLLEVNLAVPSVVYGLWGLTILVPLINEYRPPGASLLAGILILAMMVFPILVLSLDDELSRLKKKYQASADSLGLSRSTFVLKIILPQTTTMVISTSVLQLGRALGETMAILMVCGNVIQYPENIFKPIRTLTSNIALEMSYASSTHRSALFSTGFLLMLILCFLFIFINYLQNKAAHAKEI